MIKQRFKQMGKKNSNSITRKTSDGILGSKWSRVKIYVKLAILTGSTWFFGLLVTLTENEILGYIFQVLLCSQGLFIFLSFTAERFKNWLLSFTHKEVFEEQIFINCKKNCKRFLPSWVWFLFAKIILKEVARNQNFLNWHGTFVQRCIVVLNH